MRRSIVIRTVFITLALMLLIPAAPEPIVPAASANATAEQLGIDPDYMPPEMGQATIQVYIPESGHSLTGYMLDYWRANGTTLTYGNPISEPFGASNGLYSQAFERGIFQFSPHYMWTDDPAVRLMPIGNQEVKEDRLSTRADGRRTGADRRASSWLPGSNSTVRANEVANEGGRFSQVTGFSISGVFQAWYDAFEGEFYMGAPISEPHMSRGLRVQYFENGILMEKDGVAIPAPLPREKPLAYGFDPTPIVQGDMPVFSEALFVQTPNPYGIDVTGLNGRKRIEITVSEQVMRVYQGDTLVLETYVSTGLEPNDTEIGNFHVRIKFEKQDMAGFTSSTGEVVGIGTDENYEGTQTAQTYEVSDVPHVLYFNYEAEALHGAYWHNNFGQRMSHGCVNLPLDVAAFMFEFAPLGTPVDVIE